MSVYPADDETRPERALLAAVLLRALADAKAGDPEAQRWLFSVGQAWADEYLDIHPEKFACGGAAVNMTARRRARRRKPKSAGDLAGQVARRREKDRLRKRAERLAQRALKVCAK